MLQIVIAIRVNRKDTHEQKREGCRSLACPNRNPCPQEGSWATGR